MQVTITKKTDNKLEFVVTGVKLSLVNSLRRIITEEVPTWAIEYVQFQKNKTVLHEEFIAHRLGLIPLTSGKPVESESVTFTFDKTATEPTCWYSQDLVSDNPNVVPAISGIPIVKVVPGHFLKFKAIAKKGVGSDHSKWNPVSICTFVREGTDTFRFRLVAEGALDPVEIVRTALQLLKEQVHRALKNAVI